MKTAFLIVTLVFTSSAVGLAQEGFSPSGEAAKETIRSRSFQARRDLTTYLRELPPEFAQDLSLLGENSRLLDAGAGALYFAEQVVRSNEVDPKAGKLLPAVEKYVGGWLAKKKPPKTVAVSLNLERKVPKLDKLEVIWGRFFAEISDQELGQFDLIVDLQGIFAYSPGADEVLRKYLRLLKPEGTLYLSLGSNQKDGFAFRSKVKAKGKTLTLAEWTAGLKGIRTKIIEGGGATDTAQFQTLRVKRIAGARAHIPPLSLMGIDTSKQGPPTRIYWQPEKTVSLKR